MRLTQNHLFHFLSKARRSRWKCMRCWGLNSESLTSNYQIKSKGVHGYSWTPFDFFCSPNSAYKTDQLLQTLSNRWRIHIFMNRMGAPARRYAQDNRRVTLAQGYIRVSRT